MQIWQSISKEWRFLSVVIAELGILFVCPAIPECRSLLEQLGLYRFPPNEALMYGAILGVIGTAVNLKINDWLTSRRLNPFIYPALHWKSRALFISIIPPLAEEIFFRGVVQTEFGITASSLLFALIHFDKGMIWNVVVDKLFMGFWLGFSMLCTGNLWTPIIVHFINNAWCAWYLGWKLNHLRQARRLIMAGKFTEAQTAIEMIPPNEMNAFAFGCRAEIHLNLNDFSKAIDDATRAIELHFFAQYAVRAHAYMKLGQLGQALGDTETAIKKCPKLAYARRTAGLLALEEGRYADALVRFAEAHRLSKSAIDLANGAFVYIKMGDRDKAITACEQALKKDPSCSSASKNLAAAKQLPTGVEEKNPEKFLLIKKMFVEEPPNLVIVEGFQGDEKNWPPEFLNDWSDIEAVWKELHKHDQDKKEFPKDWDWRNYVPPPSMPESEYAAFLAKANEIPVVGGDLSYGNQFHALMGAGYAQEDALNFLFLAELRARARAVATGDGELVPKPHTTIIQFYEGEISRWQQQITDDLMLEGKSMPRQFHKLSFEFDPEDSDQLDTNAFTNWFTLNSSNHQAFDPANLINPGEQVGAQNADPLGAIEQMSLIVDRACNDFTTALIQAALAEHGNILAVYSPGRLTEQKTIFNDVLHVPQAASAGDFQQTKGNKSQ